MAGQGRDSQIVLCWTAREKGARRARNFVRWARALAEVSDSRASLTRTQRMRCWARVEVSASQSAKPERRRTRGKDSRNSHCLQNKLVRKRRKRKPGFHLFPHLTNIVAIAQNERRRPVVRRIRRPLPVAAPFVNVIYQDRAGTLWIGVVTAERPGRFTACATVNWSGSVVFPASPT